MNNFPIIEIDQQSGFCFGVINAIKHAERELASDNKELYCLGDIVHNNLEVERLEAKGMKTIDYEGLKKLRGKRVLFRAHGEPPQVYQWARERGIELVDATCPVVTTLQRKVYKKHSELKELGGQIVIYGKKGHAEVNGLIGQTEGKAIVVQSDEDIEQIDFSRPVALFSQTTQSLSGFHHLIQELQGRMHEGVPFEYQDSICRQVSNRMPHVKEFALQHELIIFVAGAKSSNGKVLYQHCLEGNPRSIFVSSASELTLEMLEPMPKSIGICGATSTPMWQMQEVESRIQELLEMPTE
ncbi:4-hydroxy-3-methylbut-2-enyl diphosphate reductase [Porphyromonas sp. COT-239 OH1446]|uniref:4-hydroxy-3-methylbut-2-enyl diphosphate reductase n=1 Tax=Porphyromonas sp. COT-239 OH1446 TaxID=1515613 RepID=UPI00052E0A25|nr:4-hydroxy-3-methylbut-2-enyl diphosphate reductase [Porphyromonas sp. COT-239 OH1446]KGN72201.1 4-hydroxy-3-methylbut-2-enyl diphosphate reductase [Porphyromonas sp. COT-239 OH1446]